MGSPSRCCKALVSASCGLKKPPAAEKRLAEAIVARLQREDDATGLSLRRAGLPESTVAERQIA
jgi:hypothetical protein